MDEAKVSNKGLAKRMTDEGAQRGMTLGTTHVAVKRWREGAGIRPQTAALMADVLSNKLRRRITPGDLTGLTFSGQTSNRLLHAAIRNFSYSAWTSYGGR
ncbi:hypothetical protein [Streptomyces sp. NPDC051572]|uniref:hypothetical protein n=1 Tax=Streptomyces sp. NPDC051572 TaxID=3155802 RepID=UPI00344E1F13